jgi:tRNA modification GTPase
MYYGRLADPDSGRVIDEALFIFMKAPRTFTREDVAEIHTHGGPVVTRMVLDAVTAAGARLAGPGEFTRRAFLNGRIDLSQAEAVLDIIHSKTSASLHAAVERLEGRYSAAVRTARDGILSLAASVEAEQDFPDDVPPVPRTERERALNRLFDIFQYILKEERRDEIYRDGFNVVIAGKPNVGKSSLLNALLGRDRALVTEIPGTTRDRLEEWLNLKGVPVRLIDTAGLRRPADALERLGMEKTRQALDEADMILFVIDLGDTLTEEDMAIYRNLPRGRVIIVANKKDKPEVTTDAHLTQSFPGSPAVKTMLRSDCQEGMDDLIDEIVNTVLREGLEISQKRTSAGARHIEALLRGKRHIEAALEILREGYPDDIMCIELRAASDALGEITGEVFTEDLLDRIFSTFCIGK